MAYKEDGKMRALLKTGCIAAFYTQNGYFVKVYPSISPEAAGFNDMVKFAFVKKGEAGDGFDIYMPIDEFHQLCLGIESNRLYRAIQEDSGDYPSAYKYVTGDNGSKTIAIGKGQKGIVLQGRVTDKKLNAFVPIQYLDLRKMAEMYFIVSGYKPVSGYWGSLVAVFEEGVKAVEAQYKKHKKDDKAEKENPAENAVDIGSFVAVAYKTSEGNKAFMVELEDGSQMIFLEKGQSEKTEKFKAAIDMQGNTPFKAKYAARGGAKYFLGFAS